MNREYARDLVKVWKYPDRPALRPSCASQTFASNRFAGNFLSYLPREKKFPFWALARERRRLSARRMVSDALITAHAASV